MTLLGSDHLDLLLSAALEYGVPLPASTRSAFSQLVPVAVLASEAGRLLAGHNAAAQRVQGHDVPDRGYAFTVVGDVDPVAAVKAAHAMATVCRADPEWVGSPAAAFVEAIAQAATVRVAGYAEAPWEWRRPPARFGPVLGVAVGWRPEIPGLEWSRPVAVAETAWRSARQVLVTAAGAVELSPVLEPREQVIVVLGESSPSWREWEAIGRICSGDPLLVFWPTGRPWLVAQLPELPWGAAVPGEGA